MLSRVWVVLWMRDALFLCWLDTSHGAVYMQLGEWEESVQWLLMVKQCLNIDFLVDELVQDIILPAVPNVTRTVWHRSSVICTWSTFPAAWRDRYVAFSGAG